MINQVVKICALAGMLIVGSCSEPASTSTTPERILNMQGRENVATKNLDPMKNPDNFFPSRVSRKYYERTKIPCGRSKNIDEQRIYDKLRKINNEHTKQVRFLLHVAVCNELVSNFSEALRGAQSVVFLSEVRGETTPELEVALSILAKQTFAGPDMNAWAYHRLEQAGFVLADGIERNEAEVLTKLKASQLNFVDIFIGARFDKVKWGNEKIPD